MDSEKVVIWDFGDFYTRALTTSQSLASEYFLWNSMRRLLGLGISLTRGAPAVWILALDSPDPDYWRTKVYPDYKKGRSLARQKLVQKLADNLKAMGYEIDTLEKLISQHRETACKVFRECGGYVISQPKLEADDIISLALEKLLSQGFESISIVAGDSDLLQLLTRKDKDISYLRLAPFGSGVWYRSKNTEQLYAQLGQLLTKKVGVNFSPAVIPVWKATVGDPSDNIPGVKGIGPKFFYEVMKTSGDEFLKMSAKEAFSHLQALATKNVVSTKFKSKLKALQEFPEASWILFYNIVNLRPDHLRAMSSEARSLVLPTFSPDSKIAERAKEKLLQLREQKISAELDRFSLRELEIQEANSPVVDLI